MTDNIMKKLISVTLTLILSVQIFAQVTLEECQEWAQQNYPLINQYGLINKTTEYSLSNASRSWIPQLSLSATFSYQSAVTGFPDDMLHVYENMGVKIKGLNHEQYKAGASLTQKIWDGGASGVERRSAEAQGAAQAAENDVSMYAVRERINNLYFGILLQDTQLRQNENLQNLLKNNVDLLKSYLANGVAMPYDVDMMEAELLSAQQKRIQIESSRDAYIAMLSIMTGHEISSLVIPSEELVNTNEVNRPELIHLNKQWELLSVNEKAVKTSFNPYIGAFAEGFYGNPGLNLFKSMFEDKWTWNFTGGVKVQWNFSSLYTLKTDLNKIKTAQDQINIRRETFLFNNNLQITEQQRAIAGMRELLEKDEKIVALRTSVRNAYEAKLKNGVIEVNDLLKEITNENQAKLTEEAHRIELLRNIYNLKYIVNN